ncbi:MAG: radical SAM family heme chaperone HemW [Thermoanaerobaculia bacterium]
MSPAATADPAGIYIHWPFCSRHCSYCSFTISTDESARAAYFQALRREIEVVAREAGGAAVDSVFFGGGTPSRLSGEEIAMLLSDLRSHFTFHEETEITLEANPEDVSPTSLSRWKSAGVTRLSVGVQAFHDGALREVGRVHSAGAARQALADAIRSGMDVSADLILGLPGHAAEAFLADVLEVVSSRACHLSIYLLELDRAHRLSEDRQRRPERYLTDDEQAAAYLEASQELLRRGFEHYEVSSWALPGRRARHNSKYWSRSPTLGLGVSAHEFWNGRRRGNTTSVREYQEKLAKGTRPSAFSREIDRDEAEREQIFLGARTSRGVPEAKLESWLDRRADSRLRSDWDQWLQAGIVVHREGHYALSEKGFLISNEVLCRFV